MRGKDQRTSPAEFPMFPLRLSASPRLRVSLLQLAIPLDKHRPLVDLLGPRSAWIHSLLCRGLPRGGAVNPGADNPASIEPGIVQRTVNTRGKRPATRGSGAGYGLVASARFMHHAGVVVTEVD